MKEHKKRCLNSYTPRNSELLILKVKERKRLIYSKQVILKSINDEDTIHKPQF